MSKLWFQHTWQVIVLQPMLNTQFDSFHPIYRYSRPHHYGHFVDGSTRLQFAHSLDPRLSPDIENQTWDLGGCREHAGNKFSHMEHPDSAVRLTVLELLPRVMGVCRRPVLEKACKHLGDDSPRVRRAAVQARPFHGNHKDLN